MKGRRQRARDGSERGPVTSERPDGTPTSPEAVPVAFEEPSPEEEDAAAEGCQAEDETETCDWSIFVSRWVVAAMAFALPLAGHPVFFDLYDGTKKLVAHLSIALVLLIWAVGGSLARTRSVRLGMLPLALAVALAFQLPSIVSALNPVESFLELGNRLLWLSALFLGMQLFAVPAELEAVLCCGVAGATASSLIGLAQSAGWTHPLVPQVAVPAATFGNKNMAAEYLLLWIILGLHLSMTGSVAWRRAVGAFGAGCCGAYVFLSGTRAAYVAAAVSLPVLFGLWALHLAIAYRSSAQNGSRQGCEPPGTERVVAAVGVVVASWIFVASFVYAVSDSLPKEKRRNPLALSNAALTLATYSTNWRLVVWANTLAMARDHVLTGVGLGNWRYAYPRYHRAVAVDTDFNSRVQADTPHNDYFQNLAETGILGAFGLVLFALALGRSVMLGLDPAARLDVRFTTVTILAVILAYGVDAAFSFPNAKAAPTFVLFVMLGALEGIGPRVRTVEIDRPSIVQGGSSVCALASLIVMVGQFCWALGDVRFKQGLNLYNEGRILEAHEKLSMAWRFRPFDPSLAVFHGGICQEANKIDEALEVNLRARRLHPNFTNVWNQLGNIYWRKGDRKQAEACYGEVLAIHPGFEEALRNMASLYLETGRVDKARELLERLVTLEPNEPQHLLDLGEVYRALKKRERSRERLAELVKRWPRHARGHLALGHLTREEKRASEAEQLYRKAIELDPKLVPAHYYLGTLLVDMGRVDQGRTELVRALELDPKSSMVKSALEKVAAKGGKGTEPARVVDAAEAALREEIGKSPNSPSLHESLAGLYVSRSRFDLAREEFGRTVALAPTRTLAWAKLGKLQITAGDANGALDTYRKALEKNPGDALLLNEMGLCHQGRRDHARALAAFEEAARSPSVPPEVWFNLGAERARAGLREPALDALRRFAQVWRGSEQYRQQALAEIERLEKGATQAPPASPSPR